MKTPKRAPTDMKPHVFWPGKHKGFPGPYCRHCHYSVAHCDPRGCPKRYHRPRVKKITDKERLDLLLGVIRGNQNKPQADWETPSGKWVHINISTRRHLDRCLSAIRASRRAKSAGRGR